MQTLLQCLTSKWFLPPYILQFITSTPYIVYPIYSSTYTKKKTSAHITRDLHFAHTVHRFLFQINFSLISPCSTINNLIGSTTIPQMGQNFKSRVQFHSHYGSQPNGPNHIPLLVHNVDGILVQVMITDIKQFV